MTKLILVIVGGFFFILFLLIWNATVYEWSRKRAERAFRAKRRAAKIKTLVVEESRAHALWRAIRNRLSPRRNATETGKEGAKR
jgi:hypothetical protein